MRNRKGEEKMHFENWEELEKISPITNGNWNKDFLYEYLVRSCDGKFAERLDAFFMKHRNDAVLAGLLFDFLLDEAYSGSDCQKGAAYYIARLDKELLRNEKERRLFSVGR